MMISRTSINHCKHECRLLLYQCSVFAYIIPLIMLVPLHATTVDGLVTSNNSHTVLYLDNTEVTLTAATKCKTNRALDLEIYPAENYLMHSGAHYAIRRYQSIPIACNPKTIAIGTRVRVTGRRRGITDVVADTVTEYPVTLPRTFSGGALLEENPETHLASGTPSSNLFIDGYPLTVTPHTNIVVNHQNISSLEDTITPSMWVKYDAACTSDTNIEATSLNASRNDTKLVGGIFTNVIEPKYGQKIAGEIQFGFGKPIMILPNKAVQDFVADLGRSVVPQIQNLAPRSESSKVSFRFFVVQLSEALRERKFLTINGMLPFNTSEWGASEYAFNRTKVYDMVDNTIATPDGIVLIPDHIIPRLNNRAELAALLSYSITSVLQNQIDEASHAVEDNSQYDKLHRFDAMLKIEEQNLRIGIRQMYLAGYDIREAPFAWSVARGRSVNNPVMDSRDFEKEIPWYAAYAFNYISQFYSDVDYSKLKRGQAEYTQFLDELRKADPEAFEQKK